jgi:hypothetical protein
VREAELRAELRLPGGAARALDGGLRGSSSDPAVTTSDGHATSHGHATSDGHATAGGHATPQGHATPDGQAATEARAAAAPDGNGHVTKDQDGESRHDGHR